MVLQNIPYSNPEMEFFVHDPYRVCLNLQGFQPEDLSNFQPGVLGENPIQEGGNNLEG